MCATIRRASRLVTSAYDDALRPSGLRITQFSMLQVLSEAGQLSQSELGTAMALDRTTLTRSLKPLVADGLVRIATGSDRRLKLVTLTAAGKRALAVAATCWRGAQRELKQKLGVDLWSRLDQDLRTVAHAHGAPAKV
jgi:DNA-binding MarR family transcriptional regulator